jgi:hypothetical protein
MPTLKELFKTKELPSQGGKTAEEAYAIQNSKDIKISTSDPLVNSTGFVAANLLRKTLGVRGSETLLEQEVVGARIIRGLSIPVLYGSDLPRLTLRTTPLLDDMKSAANGSEGDGGLIGGAISGATAAVSKFLGIPQAIIPTRVHQYSETGGLNAFDRKKETQNTMIELAKIKQSGEGSLLGKFLKDGGGGNLKTIGKQAIGGLISLAKDKIRGKLFGDRSTTGFNTAGMSTDGSNISFNYGSLDNPIGITISPDKITGNSDVKGLMYSKTFNFSIKDSEPGVLNFIDGDELEGGLASKTPTLVKRRMQVPAIMNLPAGEYELPLYSTLYNTIQRNDINNAVNSDGTLVETEKLTFPTIEEIIDEGEENSAILGENGIEKYSDKIELTIERDRISPIVERDEKITLLKLGIETTKDTINQLAVGSESEDDYAPLIFKAVGGDSIQFRATIDGLTETFSPSWDSNKFAGNPFSYHTYTGIERSVGFNFKIFSLNLDEHKIAWDKLNELTALVYPLGYNSNSSIKPPFLQFTLGDLYKKKYSFLDSLSYTFDDTTPWEIDEKGYRLPTMISVSVGLKFLESRGNTSGKKFYSLKPTTA